MFTNFDELVANGQFTENARDVGGFYQRPDLPPPTPSAPVTDQKQPPQENWGWKQQLEWNNQQQAWNKNIEQKMDTGFTEIRKDIAGLTQAVREITTKLDNR